MIAQLLIVVLTVSALTGTLEAVHVMLGKPMWPHVLACMGYLAVAVFSGGAIYVLGS